MPYGIPTLHLALYAGAFVIGVGLVPGLVYGLGKSYPTLLGIDGMTAHILWTMGALANGTSILLERANQTYELLAAERAEDEQGNPGYKVWPSDGEPLFVYGDKIDTYRLGFRPLGFAAAKDARQLRDMDAFQAGHGDGDREYIEERAGHRMFLPDVRAGTWLVDLVSRTDNWKDSASSQLIERGRDEALELAGGASELSTLMFLLLVLTALALGSITTLVAMGALG